MGKYKRYLTEQEEIGLSEDDYSEWQLESEKKKEKREKKCNINQNGLTKINLKKK